MAWDITMLALHLLVLMAVIVLCKNSPGFLQWLVLGLLIASNFILVCVFFADLMDAHQTYPRWMFIQIAHRVEHLAIILYVFRLFVVDQERRCLPKSSPSSPASHR